MRSCAGQNIKARKNEDKRVTYRVYILFTSEDEQDFRLVLSFNGRCR